jgi:hypothetical protein
VLWVLAGTAAHADGTGDRVVLSPRDELYQPYLADPHRASFELLGKTVGDVDIAEAGDTRYGLRLGGRFGIARHESRAHPGRAWQVSLEIGFVGEFDLDHAYDNIGWDGIYGIVFSKTLGPELRAKLGIMHRSSHVGDEYIARTGRQRINYTRQEYQAGLSWNVTRDWRTYGEIGYAYDMGNEILMAPWRAQAGLEYQPARGWWDKQLGWYAALDVSAMEERDWRADVTIRTGYVFDADSRRWSLSLMHYRGRPTIGEFFLHTESYTGVALRLEL